MNMPMHLPRALLMMPRADTTPRAIIDPRGLMADGGSTASLARAFQDFKTSHEARYDQIEASINAMMERGAIAGIGGVGGFDGGNVAAAIEPEYSAAFASYTRRGEAEAEQRLKVANAIGDRATIQAAMSVGDNSSGGYLAPVEWDRRVQQAQRATSPMRRLASVQTTSVGAYTTLWSNDQWGSGWVGETAARPATTTATLSPLTFASGEIYAMPAATQRLIDDSAINIEQWLADSVNDEFGRQESIAFVSGNGVNKPAGFLTYVTGGANATTHPGGTLDVVAGGSATEITADGLITFKYGLAAPYRQNATWLMNSQTAAAIAKMKDGDGNYIWREGLTVDEPATLLGRPVAIDEGMPNIAADATPIAFGDFRRGYVINDRIGTRVLRDPYTSKPYVMFYVTKRVGGGVLDPRAIRLLKIAAS